MRFILRILAVTYIAYLAIAVLVLMPALNFIPPWFVKKSFDRDLQTEIILFNPFTLALEVRKAALPEHSGERFVSLEKATVNLSLESLWRQGWVFDAVAVQGLYVHARQLSEDTFNFSDMIPPPDTQEPASEEETAAIPGLTIHDFAFQSEQITFTNEARAKHYSTHFDGLDIQVNDLSTVLEEGRPYRIDASGEAGGKLHWEGQVSVPGAYSEGHLALTGLSMHTMWRFAQPWLNFELKEGRFSAQADYSVNWQEGLSYQISAGEVQVAGVDIQALATGELGNTAVGLQELSIKGVWVDGPARHLDLASITIDGLAVDGWMEDSRISLAELFAVDLPAGDEPQDSSDGDAADQDDGWTAALAAVRLQNSRLGWRSQYTAPPQLEVAPIEATLENIRWPLEGDTQLALQLAVNEQVSFTIGGALDLGTGDGAISYQLQGLPMTWANPNLPAALNAIITDGFIQVDGEVALAGFAPTTIQSDGALTNFSGMLQDTEESLTNLESLRWQQLAVDLDQRSVTMEKLSIQKYAGRIHVNKDGSVNAQNIWREEVGEQAEELAEDLDLDKPWEVSLPHIVVTDSEIDFMDESLPIVFRTVIGGLNGEVLGISTEPGASANVNMQGSVDGFAPVVLGGTAEPFTQPPALDLNLSFTGVDLALLTPYSGTYAGYAIDRGLLNLDLKYALKDSHLEGHNSIRIDQMKLGKKVESDKAADLPLELAVALLTDANGVIDLQVPVSGNVDDPQFDIGSVIAKTFLNLITKAITAPFTLLANLVGSEEDLQRVNFTSGSAQLDDAGKSKLQQLGGAMAQRPALKLVITGRLNLQADRTRLQQMALSQQLLDSGLSEKQLTENDEAWEKAIDKRYRSLDAASQVAGDASAVTLRQQYDQVAASIDIPDNELKELAEARAVAIKTFLVQETQMAPDRAVIEQTALDDEANVFSGVELGAGS